MQPARLPAAPLPPPTPPLPAGRPRRLPSFTDSNQWRGYHNCIAAHAGRHAWLGMLDADEFVVFQPGALAAGSGHNLPLLLARLEAQGAGALALNWVLFGSSGHKARPPGGPLASYTACVPATHHESTHVKVIAHTTHLVDMGGTPHQADLKPGALLVDADGAPTVAPKSDTARWATAALYHYVLKSRSEFGDKMGRGSGAGNLKTWEYWWAGLAVGGWGGGAGRGLRRRVQHLQAHGRDHPPSIEHLPSPLAAPSRPAPRLAPSSPPIRRQGLP